MSDSRRPRRRELADDSDNPEAVRDHIMGTRYRDAFAREVGDENVRKEIIERILDRPVGNSQDPTSVYLVMDYWMKQWSNLLLRSSEITEHFAIRWPWNQYRWSIKTVGDILTILATLSDEHWPVASRRLFVTGRDHIGNWMYAHWTPEAEDWFDAVGACAVMLASMKHEALNAHGTWNWTYSSGIQAALGAMSEAKLANPRADLRTIGLAYSKTSVELDPSPRNPTISPT